MKKLIFAATSLLAAGAAMAADAPSFTYSAFSGSAPAVQPAKIPNWPAAANPFDGLTFDVGVTVHRYPPAANCIDVLVALFIVKPGALTFYNRYGIRCVLLGRVRVPDHFFVPFQQ